MITLYHAPQSRSSRIIWLLEEFEQPYRIAPVSIFRPRSGEGAPDPANPHPDKLAPAVEHDGVLLAESIAIVLYMTDAFPEVGLGPVVGDPQRAAYLTWLVWYAATMEPAMLASMGGELAGAPMKQRQYDAVLRRLEGALARSPYLLGETFTAADLVVASALEFGRQCFPESEAIDAYVARCKARPAALRAVERDGASGLQHAA